MGTSSPDDEAGSQPEVPASGSSPSNPTAVLVTELAVAEPDAAGVSDADGLAALVKKAQVTDLTLGALLETLSSAGDHLLDLSGSHLTVLSLPALTAWLHQHPARNLCVQSTNIGFYETCRHLMEQHSSLDLIMSHRLAFSADAAGRKLDTLHAGAFLQGRTVGLAEAMAQVQRSLQATADSVLCVQELNEREQQELRQNRKQLANEQRQRDIALDRITAQVDKMQKGCRSLYSYHRALCDSYEVLVTSIVRMQLKVGGDEVFELHRGKQIIPAFIPDFEKGVEWDGVLYVPASKRLYLVEAKSDLVNKDITCMAPRIQRTIRFMQMCSEGALPHDGATYNVKELCRSWAGLAAAEEVFGVVGAPGFTSVMLDTATAEGLLAVYFKGGSHHLQPPQAGALLCHKTGQYVCALGGGEVTMDDLEEALADEEDEVGK